MLRYDAFWACNAQRTRRIAPSEILLVTEHFIGKDILKTHATLAGDADGRGAAALSASHGWMNFGGSRMSKLGNIPDPMEYEKKYGTDVLRYFEMREIVYGLDVGFSDERLIERYNSDLANNLGNLASRVLRMAQSYCGGEVKVAPGVRDAESRWRSRARV